MCSSACSRADRGSRAQVDLLPEIKVPPQFRPPTSELLPLGLAAEVDSYLATRQPGTFLTGLKQRLMLPEHEYINSGYGTKYNVELLNSLVFYVGIKVLLSNTVLSSWYGARHLSCNPRVSRPAMYACSQTSLSAARVSGVFFSSKRYTAPSHTPAYI